MKITNAEFESVHNAPSLILTNDKVRYAISWQVDTYQLHIGDLFVYFSVLLYNRKDNRIEFLKNSDLVGILDLHGTSPDIVNSIINYIARM